MVGSKVCATGFIVLGEHLPQVANKSKDHNKRRTGHAHKKERNEQF